MFCNLSAHSSVACCPTMYHCTEGIRMCLFTSALGMFTVTTRYQCIIAPGSGCVCSMFTSLCLQLPPDHDHDVVCIIASLFVHRTSGDVYSYHLTMTAWRHDHDHDQDVVQCIIASLFVHLTSGDVYSYHLTLWLHRWRWPRAGVVFLLNQIQMQSFCSKVCSTIVYKASSLKGFCAMCMTDTTMAEYEENVDTSRPDESGLRNRDRPRLRSRCLLGKNSNSWFWEGCQHFYFAKKILKFKRWWLRSNCILAKTAGLIS